MGKANKSFGGWSQLCRTIREMREGTYLANAQVRKRVSRTVWDALGFLVFLPIWLALWFGGVWLGVELLHVIRPTVPDAALGFGRGPETFAGIVLLLSPVVVAPACAFWLANALVYSIPPARRAQATKALAGGIGFKEAQAGLVAGAVLGLAVYVALLATSILLA